MPSCRKPCAFSSASLLPYFHPNVWIVRVFSLSALPMSSVSITAWSVALSSKRPMFSARAGSETGSDAASLPVDLSKPPQRNIQSPLELVAARVAIPTGERGKKEVFASPFAEDPGQMRDYLPKLMDQVTARSGAPIIGRVNINLAARQVLAAIPGFDTALAERILSARSLVTSDDPARRDAAWLLADGVVNRQQMQRIEPWVTAGGDVGSAQIIGFYDLRSPFMRFETVVDGTTPPGRQLYYKDLRRLGRGVLGDVISVTKSP